MQRGQCVFCKGADPAPHPPAPGPQGEAVAADGFGMGREEHGEGHGGGHGQQGHGGIRKRPVDTQKRLPLIRSTKELELDETSKVDAAVVSHVPNLNPNTNFSAREPHVDYSLGLQTIRRARGGERVRGSSRRA